MTRALRCSAVLLAASSVAWATPSGTKWSATAIPVPYKLFQHASINCPGCDFPTQVQPAVLSGFARWTKGQLACTSWDSMFAGNFTTPVGPAAISGVDHQNLLIWLGGTDWTQPQAVLGLTTTTYDPGSGQILDADTQYNNNQVWKIGGSAQAIDVESIATHEAGHFLGLAHTPNVAAVMYATYTVGEIKRGLDPGTDVQDVCTVYPNQSGGGTQGDLCQVDNNCANPLVCRGPAAGGGTICTKTCATSVDCPTGYTCQTSNNGMACLIPVGSADLCKFCTNGTTCSNGLCVSDGPHMWCSVTCTNSTDCGTGYTCTPAGTFNVCVPNNATCPNPQCQTAADCPLGYACNAGKMCEATGNAGDRCEVNAYCQGCSECIGTVTEAYCRQCCGGQGNGGTCNLCTNTTCLAAQSCAQVANGLDSVCIPGGQSTCQPCSAQQACQAGLTCVGGLCHVPCNPQNPGNCQACGDQGGGQGACACPGETSLEGQPCGTDVSGGLHICSLGLVCVGTPGLCRAPCASGACGSGDACQSVSGQMVCVPNSSMGAVCGACNGSSCGTGLNCYGGRCYASCDPASPQCNGCVRVNTSGVCACDDQISVNGGVCGIIGGEPHACATGLTCEADQICHVNCTPPSAQCPSGQTCLDAGVCAAGAIVPVTDGGTTPGGTHSGGCGCGATPGAAVFLCLLLLGLRRRTA